VIQYFHWDARSLETLVPAKVNRWILVSPFLPENRPSKQAKSIAVFTDFT
jgi:hypothetical protein